MTIYPSFWLIIGLGTAIPMSLITLISVWSAMTAQDNFKLSHGKLLFTYGLALIGWAITNGVR